MDENVIHVSLLLSYSAWLHGLVDESQMRKNNKNILVVPELSSIKSSQGACAENVESLRPQMAPISWVKLGLVLYQNLGPGTWDLGPKT